MNIFPCQVLVISNENKPMGNFAGNYSHTTATEIIIIVCGQTNEWMGGLDLSRVHGVTFQNHLEVEISLDDDVVVWWWYTSIHPHEKGKHACFPCFSIRIVLESSL